ncbi:MAG TPA: DUF3592 domain-containing protein [Gammaproteobacteria bacterium]|nr:DUF3592 domain-containing protein [Gammaproteobacteria bacterium]
MTTQENGIIIALAVVFLLVGTMTALFFLSRARQAVASRFWPVTRGTLISNDARLVVYEGGNSDSTMTRVSALMVDFRYTYDVKGKRYEGSRVTFSDHVNKFEKSIRKLQKQYQGSDSIKVYYNPEKPEESVLVPGASIYNFTPLITSALFIAVGIFLWNWKF